MHEYDPYFNLKKKQRRHYNRIHKFIRKLRKFSRAIILTEANKSNTFRERTRQ